MPRKGTQMDKAPEHLRIGAGVHERSIVRAADLYAVHDLARDAPLSGALLSLDDGAIAVFRAGEADSHRSEDAKVGPVYELHPGGSLGVPTGRVFIRFADSVPAASRREALSRLGYDIEQLLSYAPNAAWLRHHSGRIDEALRGLPQLHAIAGVEHVEPQLQMEQRDRA